MNGYCRLSGSYDSSSGVLRGTLDLGHYQDDSNFRMDQAYSCTITATILEGDKEISWPYRGEYRETSQSYLPTGRGDYVWTKPVSRQSSIDWDIRFRVELMP